MAAPKAVGVSLEDLRGITESLDTARDNLAEYAEVKALNVELVLENGVVIAAVLDDGEWMLAFQQG